MDCLYCLHPHHSVDSCVICKGFSQKSLKDRNGRLVTWLNEGTYPSSEVGSARSLASKAQVIQSGIPSPVDRVSSEETAYYEKNIRRRNPRRNMGKIAIKEGLLHLRRKKGKIL